MFIPIDSCALIFETKEPRMNHPGFFVAFCPWGYSGVSLFPSSPVGGGDFFPFFTDSGAASRKRKSPSTWMVWIASGVPFFRA